MSNIDVAIGWYDNERRPALPAERPCYSIATQRIPVGILFDEVLSLCDRNALPAPHSVGHLGGDTTIHTSGLYITFAIKADPDTFLQFMQWQMTKWNGSPSRLNLTPLQRQLP